MNLQQFISKVFEADIPNGYEITKIDLSVAAADSTDGGKVFFRGGSDAAKITLEKKKETVMEVETCVGTAPPGTVLKKLYYCMSCGKNYGIKKHLRLREAAALRRGLRWHRSNDTVGSQPSSLKRRLLIWNGIRIPTACYSSMHGIRPA